MSALALALVLGSAGLHATWNLLAKRAAGGAGFTWLFASLTFGLYALPALLYWRLEHPRLAPEMAPWIVGTAILHIGYFLSLQRGYRVGDLSLVYPLARGTGPLLATVLAVTLLGERPSALALAGTGCIVLSVFALSGGWPRRGRARGLGFGYGLLTGAFIAAYTLWDGYAVSRVGVAPLLYTWLSEGTRALLLTPLALRRWPEARREWRAHRLELVGIAVLSPLAYLMVLTALSFTPISYVAPAREISILLGTLLGARLLAEGRTAERLLAASGMVLGVVLLALG